MKNNYIGQNDFRTFKKEIRKATNKNLSGMILSYEDSLDEVRELLQVRLSEELGNEKEVEKIHGKKSEASKDKEYLREKKKDYKGLIEDCVSMNNLRVQGFEDNREGFIDNMVSELAGYSILEDAFSDDEISDIYVVKWDNIWVEKNGVNEKYPHIFRSPQHFKDVLDRFLREAGKEINMGDAKVVDFELYGDRGCASSPGVSPNGYSLTIRKHKEDNITLATILGQNVMSKKLSELLETLILGETNIICAGITGSGKTTTLRALLDDALPKANKRALTFEDTQELFLSNEHTLSFVSVKSEDEALSMPLGSLIFTGLRLKPKYIIVGEVRGPEAEAAVEAAETGHSTIFSMHAGAAWNAINRLTTKYLMAMPMLSIDVAERIVGSGIDYIFIQDDIPGIGRRVTSLTEVGYDFIEKRVSLKTICSYDFNKDGWIWENGISEEKAYNMRRRGIDVDTLNKWI